MPTVHHFEHGDVDAALSSAAHVVEGSVRTGAQEHFYLETVGCIAVPKEGDEMEVHASTQSLWHTQVQLCLTGPANPQRAGWGEGKVLWLNDPSILIPHHLWLRSFHYLTDNILLNIFSIIGTIIER